MTRWLSVFWRGLRRKTTRERIAPSGVALSILTMLHEHPVAVAAGAFGLVIFIAAWAGDPKE